MAAVAASGRDEVQRAAVLGLHGRLERGVARQRDRRWRQARASIGVVGRVVVEVLTTEVAVEGIAEPVDHRGIRLQAHVAPQALREHTRDQSAFGGQCGLLFDDRRENQRFVRALQLRAGRARLPRGIETRLQCLVSLS